MALADQYQQHTTRPRVARHKRLNSIYAALPTPDDKAWLRERVSDPETNWTDLADFLTKNGYEINAQALRFARDTDWKPAV